MSIMTSAQSAEAPAIELAARPMLSDTRRLAEVTITTRRANTPLLVAVKTIQHRVYSDRRRWLVVRTIPMSDSMGSSEQGRAIVSMMTVLGMMISQVVIQTRLGQGPDTLPLEAAKITLLLPMQDMRVLLLAAVLIR